MDTYEIYFNPQTNGYLSVSLREALNEQQIIGACEAELWSVLHGFDRRTPTINLKRKAQRWS